MRLLENKGRKVESKIGWEKSPAGKQQGQERGEGVIDKAKAKARDRGSRHR